MNLVIPLTSEGKQPVREETPGWLNSQTRTTRRRFKRERPEQRVSSVLPTGCRGGVMVWILREINPDPGSLVLRFYSPSQIPAWPVIPASRRWLGCLFGWSHVTAVVLHELKALQQSHTHGMVAYWSPSGPFRSAVAMATRGHQRHRCRSGTLFTSYQTPRAALDWNNGC